MKKSINGTLLTIAVFLDMAEGCANLHFNLGKFHSLSKKTFWYIYTNIFRCIYYYSCNTDHKYVVFVSRIIYDNTYYFQTSCGSVHDNPKMGYQGKIIENTFHNKHDRYTKSKSMWMKNIMCLSLRSLRLSENYIWNSIEYL